MPVFDVSIPPPTFGQVSVPYEYQAKASDADSHSLTFLLSVSPAGMGSTPDGRINWTPITGQTGDHFVTMEVGDGAQTAVLQWIVSVVPASGPAIGAFPPTIAVVDQLYSHQLAISGGPSTIVSVNGAPGWLTFNGTDTFSGTPATQHVGTSEPIRIHVTNGVSPDVDFTFSITVTELWTTEVLDAVLTAGMNPSLAIDAQSRPRVVYDGCKYAVLVDGRWQVEYVEPLGIYDPSLALDVSGAAHIAGLRSASQNELVYTTNAQGGWTHDVVDSSSSLWDSAYASLALDAQGRVHIAYRYENANVIKYATNASGVWVTDIIDTNLYCYAVALGVGANGKAHVFYRHDQTMKYSTNASGAWTYEIVENASCQVESLSVVVDGNGKVHVAYYHSPTGAIKYATNMSGSWSLQEITPRYSASTFVSAALDSQLHAHVSYMDQNDTVLKYATNRSGVWVAETVNPLPQNGMGVSLAVGPNDEIRIAYRDDTDSMLYAKRH